MKTKIFLSCLIVMSSFLLRAQSYYPFPQLNASWRISVYDEFYNYDHSFDYDMNGDTVFNAITYHKIYVNDTLYVGALREDSSRKIYFRNSNDTTDELVYDFSANAGDTVYNVYSIAYGHYDLVVESVDSILIGADYHRKINLGYCSWIEGIGSPSGLLEAAYGPPVDGGYGLECFRVNDFQLYPYYGGPCSGIGLEESQGSLSTVAIYPQPFYDHAIMEINSANLDHCTIEFYNVMGQKTRIITTGNIPYTELNANDFKAGIYFFQVLSGNKQLAKGKLIVGENLGS